MRFPSRLLLGIFPLGRPTIATHELPDAADPPDIHEQIQGSQRQRQIRLERLLPMLGGPAHAMQEDGHDGILDTEHDHEGEAAPDVAIEQRLVGQRGQRRGDDELVRDRGEQQRQGDAQTTGGVEATAILVDAHRDDAQRGQDSDGHRDVGGVEPTLAHDLRDEETPRIQIPRRRLRRIRVTAATQHDLAIGHVVDAAQLEVLQHEDTRVFEVGHEAQDMRHIARHDQAQFLDIEGKGFEFEFLVEDALDEELPAVVLVAVAVRGEVGSVPLDRLFFFDAQGTELVCDVQQREELLRVMYVASDTDAAETNLAEVGGEEGLVDGVDGANRQNVCAAIDNHRLQKKAKAMHRVYTEICWIRFGQWLLG